MEDYINTKLKEWDDDDAIFINGQITYLAKRLYDTYEPAKPPKPMFHIRLQDWIRNVEGNAEQELNLFKSIVELTYIGPDEFDELYRKAYDTITAKWLIDLLRLDLDDLQAGNKIKDAVKKTWFCPISDSMRISSFMHINNVPNDFDFRPDWRSMEQFGNRDEIEKYCTSNGIERLVLLEDFVGGGSQMANAVEFAASFSDVVKILVIPLVICPKGMQMWTTLFAGNKDIVFLPALEIGEARFITENEQPDEPLIFEKLRDIAHSTFVKVAHGCKPGQKPYHPLGYDKTGGLIVMYSNTPDNTLPLFHNKSNKWDPLFPRHNRV